MAASKTLTREQRVERARRAAQARESLDRHVAKVVEQAPALTAEQVERLRGLLTPVREADRA
jgi:hypothetical protein